MDTVGPITQLLEAVRRGEVGATDRLYGVVYDELKTMARRQLGAAPRSVTPTVLVHELFMKLSAGGIDAVHDRAHFFNLCARVMRQLLVDDARRRLAARRGGGAAHLELFEVAFEHFSTDDVLAVEGALERLEQFDPRLAKVVELRFHVGLTEGEIAALLEVTERTVRRDWRKARAFVYREMTREAAKG